MTFKANPNLARDMARSPEVQRILEDVAQEVVEAIEAATPRFVTEDSTTVFESGSEDGVGFATIRSPLWHFPEYGTSKTPPAPYIRPAAQAVLNRRGGRLVEKGKQ